jgi:hypothetical protein
MVVETSCNAVTQTNVARIFRSAYERVANLEMAVRASRQREFSSLTEMSSQMRVCTLRSVTCYDLSITEDSADKEAEENI